jgi:ABC-2 type transport system permease protein
VIGYGLALLVFAATSVWLWPSVRDTLQNFEVPPALEAIIGSDVNFATPAGYLSGRYFGWTEILVIVFAVIAGTGAIAGEEAAGTIELLLAQPIARATAVLEKLAALVVASVAIVAIGFVGFLISVPTVDIDISIVDLGIACATMLPITLFFLALALWAGAVAPSRTTAAAALIGVATITYFIYTLSNGIGSVQWLRYATPFYYYGNGSSLTHGVVWWHVGVLLALAVVFVVLTLLTFDRRDISVGGATGLGVRGVLRRVAARHGV